MTNRPFTSAEAAVMAAILLARGGIHDSEIIVDIERRDRIFGREPPRNEGGIRGAIDDLITNGHIHRDERGWLVSSYRKDGDPK